MADLLSESASPGDLYVAVGTVILKSGTDVTIGVGESSTYCGKPQTLKEDDTLNISSLVDKVLNNEGDIAVLTVDVDNALLKDGSNAMSGGLPGFAGTALLPGYTFDGDANTGMWSPAADTIAWSTGGIEYMRLTSDGRLGLWTTSPGQFFDLEKSHTGALGARVSNKNTASGDDARFLAKTAAGSGNPYSYYLQAGGEKWSAGLYVSTGEYRLTNTQGLASSLALAFDTSMAGYVPQTLAIGQSAVADASAVLELGSTTGGFLPPRWTTAQRDIIPAPVEGLRGWNTTNKQIEYHDGSAWVQGVAHRAVTTTATVVQGNRVIYADTSSGSFTVTLSPVADSEGMLLRIKNRGSSGNVLTVDGDGSETVEGELTQLLDDGEALTLHCDGATWSIL